MSNREGPRALYETMSSASLRDLRKAFEMDAAAATSDETVAFGRNRIALIDSVLAERNLLIPLRPETRAAIDEQTSDREEQN